MVETSSVHLEDPLPWGRAQGFSHSWGWIRSGWICRLINPIFSPQEVDAIESHTFATSTFTQFCILFKRTFLSILRDTVRLQVGGEEAGKDLAFGTIRSQQLGWEWGPFPSSNPQYTYKSMCL